MIAAAADGRRDCVNICVHALVNMRQIDVVFYGTAQQIEGGLCGNATIARNSPSLILQLRYLLRLICNCQVASRRAVSF